MKTNTLMGIMSGYRSQHAPLDYVRGAISCVHACGWADLVQPVWDLFFEDKNNEARKLRYSTLPILRLEGVMGMRYAREVPGRRSVFKNTNKRRTARELPTATIRKSIVFFRSLSRK